MKRNRMLSILCCAALLAASLAGIVTATAEEAPLEIRLTYSDNPTLPFDPNWLAIKEAEKLTNTKLTFEIIPNTDWTEKIRAMLNSGTAPDALLYVNAATTYAEFGLNGALVPMNNYKEQWPNYYKLVEDWGMEADIQDRYLIDGNLYYMSELYDFPFFDAGPIIRTDLLEKFGLEVPTTFDELYEVAKVFKANYPDSYPITNLVDERVTYRMTMPSFGISLGVNASNGTHVTSYDYATGQTFAGATSELYREYLRYLAKCYAEGLYDPEFANASDVWATKLSTGAASITWAYYDQLGGLVANSTIDGISFGMFPPLEGPVGAYHQPKSRTGNGIAIPATTLERRGEEDVKAIMSALDKMFFSPEGSELWCLGVEGVTFTRDADGDVVFNDEILASPDGPYKAMQLLYGCGTAPLQLVWENAREMYKYDEYYGEVNAIVAEMGGIQSVPPAPKFTPDETEEVNFIKAPLVDMFNTWTNEFIRGTKSIETDWDTFVAEMEAAGINDLVDYYNIGLSK
ncbi:MAG: extracellular solute-binding protein [Oscillospiraceae bacterium]|jgi:putative aldouronate transport system substrate-binding protein|nr:extracellular solute-binding protein [Oscillospiraceae bacterium]